MYHSIRPGKYWYDTDGNLIQAHAGSIIYVDGKYYWYGENKSGVTGRATGSVCPIWHRGVQLYSSNDLYNWKNEGTLMVEYEDENHPFYVGRIMDRPHILYNEKTKKFVLWAKIGGLLSKKEGFGNAYFAVCESECITGPFHLVNRVKGIPVGDFDLIPCDDKVYVIFEKPHTEMMCMELNDSYTDVASKMSSHLPKPFPPFTREAPAFFEYQGERYLLTSGTTGYFPNKSILYKLPSFHGEWIEIGDPCEGDVHHNSFHAQFSSVFRHPFRKDLYIALGDRWLNDLPPQMPSPDEIFERGCNPEKRATLELYDPADYTDENTSMATYVWLPICFNEDGEPYIVWRDEWQVEDYGQEEMRNV